jgi:hypothetical protein
MGFKSIRRIGGALSQRAWLSKEDTSSHAGKMGVG